MKKEVKKSMAKNNRKGQAKIWTTHAIKKMRENLRSPLQRLAFEISLWTGERMGAIVQLKVSDVYDEKGRVLEQITFRSDTRKATRWGQAKTRQVYINPILREFLSNIAPPKTGYLLPSRSSNGHITVRAVDDYWRNIFALYPELEGYSTHSSRRWLINQLRKNGTGLLTISEIMAMTISTVRHYCDDDPEACRNAIAQIDLAA